LVGVIEEANKHAEIENLYGAVHGVEGMATDEFVDLKSLSAEVLAEVAGTPGAALGSSRVKPDD
jgi:6-phosphofructokinase 1